MYRYTYIYIYMHDLRQRHFHFLARIRTWPLGLHFDHHISLFPTARRPGEGPRHMWLFEEIFPQLEGTLFRHRAQGLFWDQL